MSSNNNDDGAASEELHKSSKRRYDEALCNTVMNDPGNGGATTIVMTESATAYPKRSATSTATGLSSMTIDRAEVEKKTYITDSYTFETNQQEQDHATGDREEDQFVSIPSYRDYMAAKYYETGRHWKLGKLPPSMISTECCYCGKLVKYGSFDSFAKSFTKLTLHFTRNDCTGCPPHVRTTLQQLGRNPGKEELKRGWTTTQACETIWARLYPEPKAKRAHKIQRLEDTAAAVAENAIKTKPWTTDAVSGVKLRKSADENVDNSAARATSAEHTILKNAEETNVTTTTTTTTFVHPMKATPDDLSRIVQNVRSPLRLIYHSVMSNGGRVALQKECSRQGFPNRSIRIWRIISKLQVYPPHMLEPMMAALEILRDGKSVQSFLDGKMVPIFQEAERMVRDGAVVVEVIDDSTPPRTWHAETSPDANYVEETAFLYHDPPTNSDPYEEVPPTGLQPLPPQGELNVPDEVIDNVSYPWTLDRTTLVVTCDFSDQSGFQTKEDEIFWGTLLESNHVTVVSNGLLDVGSHSSMWDLSVIETLVGDRHHHKFKRFVKKEDGSISATQYEETDELLQGRIGEYIDYLHAHYTFANNATTTSFEGTESRTCVPVNMAVDPLYLIDLDLPRVLPRHYDDFVNRWKLPQVLPGGPWCMTNCLPSSARPFMGPNMYITPGGAYTQFHQDGNGTVDSGHYVLSGYNEVVMLRRLPERHKQTATEALPGNEQNSYDALYGLPHGRGPKPGWPTKDTISVWRAMGYHPSVFILGPGQHVHINKGRLHAFRKVTNEMLPEDDCHYELRRQLIEDQGWKTTEKAPLCVSIAWDWQFVGVSPEGINREVTSALECQLLVDKRIDMSCLAIPRACLLALGNSCLPLKSRSLPRMVGAHSKQDEEEHHENGDAVRDNLLRGLTPSLLFVLNENIKFIRAATENTHNITKGTLHLAPESDTALNPLTSAIDPDGNDYFCKLCQKELENTYLHCNGCEGLLQRDFNICTECYTTGGWRDDIGMAHGASTSRSSMCYTSCMGHTGSFVAHSYCQCPEGGPCRICGNCRACSCTCHSSFTIRRRYFDLDQLVDMERWIVSDTKGELLEYGELTNTRLALAIDRRGRGHKERFGLLNTHPRLCPRNAAANTEDECSVFERGDSGSFDQKTKTTSTESVPR